MNEQETNDEKFAARSEAFFKEYGELVEKHKMDFVHMPYFIPTQDRQFGVTIASQVVDVKGQPTLSPIQL